jgi:hypothetical protein
LHPSTARPCAQWQSAQSGAILVACRTLLHFCHSRRRRWPIVCRAGRSWAPTFILFGQACRGSRVPRIPRGDAEFALAGGNVCAVAQKNGIVAFVLDGVVRDIAEIRAMRFPVFAKGVLPKPGAKELLGTLQQPIRCGGVAVSPDDVIVADEEGIVVVPAGECAAVLEAAQARATADASQSLEEWRAAHRARVAKTLADRGFSS